MVEQEKLIVGNLYFHLHYFDEELRVPDIKTLYFLSQESTLSEKSKGDLAVRWIFQEAESRFKKEGEDVGLISLTDLQCLHDWDGLIGELSENWECQKTGSIMN